MGFGPLAQNRKKIAPEIGPEIGPAEKIEKNGEKLGFFRVLSYFFPIFSAGPILGPISGAVFFPILGRRPETHFLPETQVLKCSAAKHHKGMFTVFSQIHMRT